MIELSPTERRSLRARAHPLHPVVSIGAHGLTPSVVHEIDVALAAHELIKIRAHVDDRDAREALLARVCDELGAAPVQHLGKLLIVYRRKPEAANEAKAARAPTKHRPSGKTARRPPPRALAPDAPRRRRRAVMAATQQSGARNEPTVRRRRNKP